MSSCPLIQYLVLDNCDGLRTVRVNNAHNNLKHFGCYFYKAILNDHSIEIDAPSLETIRIRHCQNWNHHNNYFPRLKSLYLSDVRVRTDSFVDFSSNFPCLEVLDLNSCDGYEEFQLLSLLIKAAVDATNIFYFKLSPVTTRPSISFKKTSSEGKAHIRVRYDVDSVNDPWPWFIKLNELLKPLISQSQISLHLTWRNQIIDEEDTCDGLYEPFVVEILSLSGCLPSSFRALFNWLFRIFRPRYICMDSYYGHAQAGRWERVNNELHEFLPKIMNLEDKDTGQSYFWQEDLEELSIKVQDKNGKEWTGLEEGALPNNQLKQKILFQLKWRGLS